jgi:hypothetical protein
VPQLEVTLSALAREHAAFEAPGRADFDLRIVAWLRFAPNLAAQDIPSRAEVASDHLLLSCEADDVGCVEEAAETESEVERLLGELE